MDFRTDAPRLESFEVGDDFLIAGYSRGEVEFLYHEIFIRHQYDLDPAYSMPDRPIILDVGANVGVFSIFAKRRWPGAEIYAFEPLPLLVEALHANLDQLPQVRIIDVGLGRTEEEVEFVCYPNNTILSGANADPERDLELARRHVMNVLAERNMPGNHDQIALDLLEGKFQTMRDQCRVRRLGDLIEELGIEQIDLLKIDVEGTGIGVLEGLNDSDWPRIRAICMEIDDRVGGGFERAEAILSGKGFHLEWRQPERFEGTEIKWLSGYRR